MNTKIEELKAKLVEVRAKEKRTGGSRAQTLEIDRIKWAIKCCK